MCDASRCNQIHVGVVFKFGNIFTNMRFRDNLSHKLRIPAQNRTAPKILKAKKNEKFEAAATGW